MARASLILLAAAVAMATAVGCKGGDEGDYTGPTKTFPNADKMTPPSKKGGGPAATAEP